jgi:chemotaxis protein methyltransferase CheR
MNLTRIDLNQAQFKKISTIVHRSCGIDLGKGKKALVRARLTKRLRALCMQDFEDYLNYINSKKGAAELCCMIDAITTNKTGFFREMGHFNFLRDRILADVADKRIRYWSAACSSGEEPFSLAILLREHIRDIDTRDCLILATDISAQMIEKARNALYSKGRLRDLPRMLVKKNFHEVDAGAVKNYKVKDEVRAMVRFARLNLIDPWPMKGPFNIIFCRNVMIYFDKSTQHKLVDRFWELLEPGGYLFVGHSECLSAVPHRFTYVRPAIYRK